MKIVRPLAFASLSLVCTACANTPVPKMTPSRITAPKFEGMEPRGLGVIVNDERAVNAKFKKDTEEHVTATLRGLLDDAGIGEPKESRDQIWLNVHFPSSAPTGVDPQHCVEIHGEMKHQSGFRAIADATSCPEARKGVQSDAAVSRTFDEATDAILKKFEAAWVKHRELLAPPSFEAARITTPEFAVLTSKTLALDVNDSFASDGSVGASLKAALTEALGGKGIRVTETSAEKLVISLAKPTEGLEGRDPNTCVQFRGELAFAAGSVSGTTLGCRGSDEKTHHEVLSQLLALLDEEAKKLADAVAAAEKKPAEKTGDEKPAAKKPAK